VDFAPTFNCNLKCTHCFAETLKKKNKHVLAVSDYKRIAEECIKLGTVHFAFQGGEPLLYGHLEEVIRALKPHKSLISITTNGTLLTEEKIKKLKKIGVDMLTFSLDSTDAKEHDNFRRAKGTFKKAYKMIKIALKNNMGVTINTMVTHENLKSGKINKMIRLTKKLNVKLNLILPVAIGRWSGNYDIMLTENDKKMVNKIVNKNPHVRRDLDSGYTKKGCGAVKEMLYITPYGDVFPCPFIHVSMGNVLKEPLKKIRERGLKIKYFSKYHPCCLASEDRGFIDKHLSVTFNKKELPVTMKEMFGKNS